MKSILKSILFALPLCLVTHANAALVSLNFTSLTLETGSPTVFSSQGDVWRANDVRIGGGAPMDAIFTITSTSGLSPSTVFFATSEAARGNNVRVRVQGINTTVTIRIDLVNADTTNAYTGFVSGDSLITQFSDLDSDVSSDRSDFAGVFNGQFSEVRTSDNVTPGSSLLDVQVSPTFASDYTVGILDTPWGPQGNVASTSAAAQSPVTVAFLYDQPTLATTFNIVLGQRSNGAFANRHIDIDMTPDFIIIPEPSSALLGGIGMLLLLRRRR